jgi:hypothetical protein
MNNIVKIQIPVSEFYQILNSTNVLNAQAAAKNQFEITNKDSYDRMRDVLKQINEVIKEVETSRKNVTAPLDSFKSNLIDLEKTAIETLKAFVQDGKKKMIDYSNELDRKRAEAEAKLKREAEESLQNAVAIADVMSTFTDRLFATTVNNSHTNNVRTTIKAKVVGDVDWNSVISVLLANGSIKVEDLLKGLPKAMESLNVQSIKGIELYESKTQVIR